jgi:hypothetical protein
MKAFSRYPARSFVILPVCFGALSASLLFFLLLSAQRTRRKRIWDASQTYAKATDCEM